MCCVCSALLSPHRDDLLPCETLIVLLSKICDRPSIMSRHTECYCGVCIPLFTISVLAPNSGGFPFIIPIMSEELTFESFVVMRCWSFEVCNDDVFESLVKFTADDVPLV